MFKKFFDKKTSYKVMEALTRTIRTIDSNDPFMYIFVRDDLSEAQKIIQVGHAIERLKDAFNRPVPTIPSFALMGVDNEFNLLDVSDFLKKQDIDHHIFFEPDIDEHTAIATVPLYGSERLIMNNFKLFRGRE